MIQAGYVYLTPDGNRPGSAVRTVEAAPGLMVDLDADGRPLGVEVLGAEDWRTALVALAMAGRLRVVPAASAERQERDGGYLNVARKHVLGRFLPRL